MLLSERLEDGQASRLADGQYACDGVLLDEINLMNH